MAKARIIYRELATSDKWNNLYQYSLGELAQLIYLCYYPFSDDWGHLEYNTRLIKNLSMPESKHPFEETEKAIALLLDVGLWEYKYEINNKEYVYIYNFEELQRDGIRHRRRGDFPDETGEKPSRRGDIDIVQSLLESCEVRKNYKTKHNIT